MECELNSHGNPLRQLREPVPPLGKLIAVPSLPIHYFARAEPLRTCGMPSVPTSFNFDSDQVAEVGQTECNYASAPTCVGGAHRRKIAETHFLRRSHTPELARKKMNGSSAWSVDPREENERTGYRMRPSHEQRSNLRTPCFSGTCLACAATEGAWQRQIERRRSKRIGRQEYILPPAAFRQRYPPKSRSRTRSRSPPPDRQQ